MQEYDVVVIGSGPAGATLVAELAGGGAGQGRLADAGHVLEQDLPVHFDVRARGAIRPVLLRRHVEQLGHVLADLL